MSGAHAAEDIYVGVGLGKAKGDESLGSLDQKMAAAAIDASAYNLSANRSAYSLYVGKPVNGWLGAEIAYTDLGDVDVELRGDAASVDAFFDQLKDIHVLTADGFSLRLVARRSLMNRVDYYGRLGFFLWQADYTLNGNGAHIDIEDSGVDVEWAIGVSYQFHPQWSGRLEWGHYELDDAVSITTANVQYHFH